MMMGGRELHLLIQSLEMMPRTIIPSITIFYNHLGYQLKGIRGPFLWEIMVTLCAPGPFKNEFSDTFKAGMGEILSRGKSCQLSEFWFM